MSPSLLLGKLLTSSAKKFPEKVAVTFGEQRFTYRSLEERANRVGNAVLGLGLKKGDRCGILFYNRAEWLEIYFGLARTGVIAVPVNFRFSPSEVEYVLNHSEPKALIYEESFLPVVEAIRGKVPSIQQFICLGKGEGVNYQEWMGKASDQEPQCAVEENDPFFIAYTSGTTGFPKGAVISHRNLIIHYSLLPGAIRQYQPYRPAAPDYAHLPLELHMVLSNHGDDGGIDGRLPLGRIRSRGNFVLDQPGEDYLDFGRANDAHHDFEPARCR